MELFSPGHLIPLLIIVAVLFFGWKQLPDMARSAGRSLRVFKTEMKGLSEDDEARAVHAPTPPAPPAAPGATPPASVPAPPTAPAPGTTPPVQPAPWAAAPVAPPAAAAPAQPDSRPRAD